VDGDAFAYSAEFRDLVTQMIAYNQSDRITLDKIKEHPWMLKDELPTEKEVHDRMSQLKR
jgi:serine/threonine protein kinase